MAVWKYLGAGKVKHSFSIPNLSRADCGRANSSYRRIGNTWFTDEEGLAKLPKCKRCVVISESMP